jgi:Lon protease-like protein
LNVLKKYEDGRLDIAAEGERRFEIIQINQERSFLQAEVSYFEDELSLPSGGAMDTVVELHEQLFAVLGQTVDIARDTEPLSFHLANELPVDLDFKQALLEMKSKWKKLCRHASAQAATDTSIKREFGLNKSSRLIAH